MPIAYISPEKSNTKHTKNTHTNIPHKNANIHNTKTHTHATQKRKHTHLDNRVEGGLDILVGSVACCRQPFQVN